MPFKVQRVPRGLNNLLSIVGGATPPELEDRVRGILDLLQFYGQSQLQFANTNNAALAEAGSVTTTLSVDQWTLLFNLHYDVVYTATLTALNIALGYRRVGASARWVRNDDYTVFGATKTGIVSGGHVMAYPMIMPPGSAVIASPQVIGTDATVNLSVSAEFAILG